MNKYNTKITYYKEGQLDFKKTAQAYACFYIARCGKIALVAINERLSQYETNSKLSGSTQ